MPEALPGDEGPVRDLERLFATIVQLLQVPYSPEGRCDIEAKRAYLSRFHSSASSNTARSLVDVPEPLLDLLYACLATDTQYRPACGE